MNRGGKAVLIVSLALNLGFAASWITHREIGRHLNPAPPARWDEAPAPPPSPGQERLGGRHANWAQRRARWLDKRLHLDERRRRMLGDSLRPLQPGWLAARKDLEDARQAFHEEMMRPVVDRRRALRLSAEINRRQARLDSLTTEALVREARVLRPEERHRPGKWFPRRCNPQKEERR